MMGKVKDTNLVACNIKFFIRSMNQANDFGLKV